MVNNCYTHIYIDSIGVLHTEKTKIAGCRNIGLYIAMVCAKYGFTQSMDCPAQSSYSDQYFAQPSMDFVRIP